MIPIHENNCHWTFVFLDPEAKELTYYDSFRSDGTNIMHNILAFIEEEHNHNNMAFNKESWNLKNDPNTPLQDDKHSCGYLAILNAECVALHLRIHIIDKKSVKMFYFSQYTIIRLLISFLDNINAILAHLRILAHLHISIFGGSPVKIFYFSKYTVIRLQISLFHNISVILTHLRIFPPPTQ